MGASESSARSNGTKEEEEEEDNSSVGSSMAAAARVAAGAAVAVWGISNMGASESSASSENNSSVGSSMAAVVTVAADAAVAVWAISTMLAVAFCAISTMLAVAVWAISKMLAVAVWGISKRLSNNKETEEISNRHVTESPLLSTDRIINEAHSPRSTWSPPPPGRYKMNTDGSCQPTPTGLTGYAGILRDHDGKWVHGFIGFIGVGDSYTSELHGILKGLELLDRLNYKGAILENDLESLVKSVNGDPGESVLACGPDIKKCRQLRFKNRITVEYVRGKDANRCADKLADMARKRGEAYLELKFRDLPLEIRKLVREDALVNS